MLRFPSPHPLDSQQEIRVLLNFGSYIDHTGRPYKFSRIDSIHTIFRQILPAYPVDQSVKVGAGVLAGLEAVPVPCRPTLIIAREFPHAEGRSVVELRREWKQRRTGRQRLGEIDHPEGATAQLCDQFLKNLGHR